MIQFFHLQNDRREILLLFLLRLPCIHFKGSSGCGHSRANGSREMENQPEILVHEPNGKLRCVIALHHSLQLAYMSGSDDRGARQNVQEAIAIKTGLLTECNGFGDRLHPDTE